MGIPPFNQKAVLLDNGTYPLENHAMQWDTDNPNTNTTSPKFFLIPPPLNTETFYSLFPPSPAALCYPFDGKQKQENTNLIQKYEIAI